MKMGVGGWLGSALDESVGVCFVLIMLYLITVEGIQSRWAQARV